MYVVTDGASRRYVGMTNFPARRIRQHNGEISGGARATRGRTWAFEAIVSGFETKSHAMQAEWRLKRERRRHPRRAGPAEWLRGCADSFGEGPLGARGWTSRSPPPGSQTLSAWTDASGRPERWPPGWGWGPLEEGMLAAGVPLPDNGDRGGEGEKQIMQQKGE